MLKITKGLKKKKKGKKSKHKDEELFKPEELEAYRREHQQQQVEKGEEASGNTDDEWKKFQALTADIDSVLRKTQGDLDRIKSTSFFQRKPTPSEVKKAEETAAAEAQEKEQKFEEEKPVPSAGVVEISESESEEEEEDDIFDTSFVDAVESGEVKLAYIPESPTQEEVEGDDPFDTSIAERAILGPAFNKKGKKLVPLGAAVEVLTGRVELPTCAVSRKPVNRRVFQQPKDLLLGSFDVGDTTTLPVEVTEEKSVANVGKSLLDEDESLPIDVPIDLSGASLHQVIPQETENAPEENLTDVKKNIVQEFDVLKDDEDDEFAQLAAESITKTPVNIISDLPKEVPIDIPTTFEVEFEENPEENFNAGFEVDNFEVDTDDPFDTTFADNILPGKAELKLIENEILNAESDINQEVEQKFSDLIISKVSIHVTNPTGERESISSLDRVDESSLNSIQPIHRDLLGGSNTDLSKIGDEPIKPDQATEESFSDYSDPFDTSSVDQISAPGQAELKFLEKELLGDTGVTLEDEDFNPRESEPEKPLQRPDVLEVNPTKQVKFVTPTLQADLLGADNDVHGKYSKPLTPYYVRENSIPECVDVEEEEEVIEDPFDTSFVSNLAPGKAELKLLEDEFAKPAPELKRKLSDPDFDPRADNESKENITKQSAPCRPKPPELPLEEVPKVDLLAVEEDISVKVLTPAVETGGEIELSYSDPFDTSIASNILPGKAELKLLENELISTSIKRNLTDPEFDPRTAGAEEEQIDPPKVKDIEDILGNTEDQSFVKPLTPYAEDPVTFQIGAEEEIDPFDTSIADNIAPGRAELKLLESELI